MRSCSAGVLVLVLAFTLITPSTLLAQRGGVSVRARLLRIEDTRRDEPSYVDSLLEGSDRAARAAAALTVGRIGARAHLVALRRLAAEPDTQVAANAMFALALLKDTGAAGVAIGALHDASARGAEAARVLGELGSSGRDGIVRVLGDSSVPPSTRQALLLAAARMRPVPAAAVIPWLGNADSAVAWRAAYALARGRSAAGARALLGNSASPWSSVREQVARGAAKALVGDSLATEAKTALSSLVHDPEARVRVNAIRALASFGTSSRGPVVSALSDADMGVALTAAQSLSDVLGDDIADWTHAFDARNVFAIQKAVADAGMRKGKRLDEYGGWAESKDWHKRVAAAEFIARGSRGMLFIQFARVRKDADGRVRAAATAAITPYVDSAGYRDSVRALLRTQLGDPDVQVRTAALGGLSRGTTTAEFAMVLKSYKSSLKDRDNDARLAFWRFADSALARAPSLADSVSPLLTAVQRPTDPLERMAAAHITQLASWADSAGTARPLPWYEARAREAGGRRPVLHIETARGVLELALLPAEAPLTVYNITSLARRGYFNGQEWHRVVPNFVVQGGDPRGDGTGGPGFAIRDELNRKRYLRGTVGMALSGPNTGGSQFFVTHSPQPHLDGGYTVFGEMVRGGDVLDRIVQGDRIVRITVR